MESINVELIAFVPLGALAYVVFGLLFADHHGPFHNVVEKWFYVLLWPPLLMLAVLLRLLDILIPDKNGKKK